MPHAVTPRLERFFAKIPGTEVPGYQMPPLRGSNRSATDVGVLRFQSGRYPCVRFAVSVVECYRMWVFRNWNKVLHRMFR